MTKLSLRALARRMSLKLHPSTTTPHPPKNSRATKLTEGKSDSGYLLKSAKSSQQRRFRLSAKIQWGRGQESQRRVGWSWRGSGEENEERRWEITGQGDYDFRDTDLVTFLPQHREGALRLHLRLSFYLTGAPEGSKGKGADACWGDFIDQLQTLN